MSMALLRALNGDTNGRFRAWMDALGREPRIAWYPSAQRDFRPLMHLAPGFAKGQPARGPEPQPPDIFLYTDYYPWQGRNVLDRNPLFRDRRTTVTLRHLEELPRLDLPLDRGIVTLLRGGPLTGRVVFMELEVRSDLLGTLQWPLVYAFCENEAFCARMILPLGGRLSHIVQVDYDSGGRASGTWLQNVLGPTGCEVFLTSGDGPMASGDERAMQLYPALRQQDGMPGLVPYRVTPGRNGSRCGDVTWYRLIEPPPPGLPCRVGRRPDPEFVELRSARLHHVPGFMKFLRAEFPEASARIPEGLPPFPGGYGEADGVCTHPAHVRSSWLRQADRFTPQYVPDGFLLAALTNAGTSEYLLLMWRQGDRCFWFRGRYVCFVTRTGDLYEQVRQALHDALARWDAGTESVAAGMGSEPYRHPLRKGRRA